MYNPFRIGIPCHLLLLVGSGTRSGDAIVTGSLNNTTIVVRFMDRYMSSRIYNDVSKIWTFLVLAFFISK